MTNHTLFVCQSCHHDEDLPEGQPADGDRLIKALKALQSEQPPSSQLTIQPVSCLWACDRACVAAFAAPQKPTYMFAALPTEESAVALLAFAASYCQMKTGNVPWKQFPEALQSTSVTKVPGVK